MRMIFPMIFPLGAAAILVACTLSPRQQCESQARRALADNRVQIAQAQEAIDRGVIHVPADNNIGVRYCLTDHGTYRLCLRPDPERQTFRRVPVDIAAEEAKLRVLMARRAELRRELAQCATLPAG